MHSTLLFSGSSNKQLAKQIAAELGTELGKVQLSRFADGETRPWIEEDVRNKTVFVIQSLSLPMDEHIMEAILMGDAIKRGAPKRLVAVIPYFGYARQDKQHRMGEPVSARVVAKMLEVIPFHEIITIDLHNDAIVGFFRNPVTHLSTVSLFASYLQEKKITNGVIVAPDVGGVKRARNLASYLHMNLAVMEKNRNVESQDESSMYQTIGDVSGKTAILVDDIISTGGTIAHAAQSLQKEGAKQIIVVATHGIFASDAISKLSKAPINEIVVTDTVAQKSSDHIHVVSTAKLLAQAIQKIS